MTDEPGQKHTPGPWRYRPFKHDDWGMVRAGNAIVAVARAGNCSTDEDAHRAAKTDPYEANARLIAAAPEMLAALRKLDEYWLEDFPEGPEFHIQKAGLRGPPLHGSTIDIWLSARTAIAKAEGRE